MGTRARGIAALTVAALILAGCGGDDDGKESADKPTRSTTSTTEAPTTTEPKAPTAEARPVAVTLGDDSFDLPAALTAGPTRFQATNRGKQVHGVVLVELADGQTPEALVAALADDAAETLGSGRLVPGPQNAAPGSTQSTLVDLEAGAYVAVSTVAGAQAFPPAAGMVRPVTVTAAAAPTEGTALPTGPTITLDDDTIEVPEDFDGTGLLRVENAGEEPHELVLYRLADDVTFVQAMTYLTAATRPAGPSPVVPVGGIGALSPGGEAAVDLELRGGIHVFICQFPGADGEPHAVAEQVNLP